MNLATAVGRTCVLRRLTHFSDVVHTNADNGVFCTPMLHRDPPEIVDVYPVRPVADAAFLWRHPAHWLALAFGAGLSPLAAGTVGTLWAWLAYALLSPWLDDTARAAVIVVSLVLGWWACSVTARHLERTDPGCIVWDEVVAFWIVLWLVTPTSFSGQLGAFLLFRFFDAAKPGPVGWAERVFYPIDPYNDRWAWAKAGAAILLDDLVAALCTLLVVAWWRTG